MRVSFTDADICDEDQDLDFESAEIVSRIVDEAKKLGIVCYWFLSLPNSFPIAPPLTINHDQIEESCALILQAIDAA